MKSIVSFLQDCRLGKKQVYNNLTVFPVLLPNITEPYYLTLEQAIEQEMLVVTEVDAAGSVGRLRLRNHARQPILLIEGEELQGAKQNRVVNASLLIAAKTETTIFVSCVEEMRWHAQSAQFSPGKKVMHATLRRDAQRGLRENLSRGDGQRCDQGAIWANIAEKSRRMQVDSPTRAMSDVFDRCADRLSDYSRRFHQIEQQVGALFAIDGRVIGLECFGCSDTFGRFFDKLIDSYALDAIESADTVAPVPAVRPGRARGFVESVKKAKGQRHDPVSLGATIAFSSRITARAPPWPMERISPAWARYISERIWHQSQSIQKLIDGGIEVNFRVAGLDEIRQWVLGLGPEAVVVEPPELKNIVASSLSKALEHYRERSPLEETVDSFHTKKPSADSA